MTKEKKEKKERKEKKKREKTKLKTREKKQKTFKAFLAGERVFSNTKEAFDLYSKSHFGEPIERKIY
ncbi:MAG: hypothetical protein N3G19_03350, partial [Candidatus Pacearchaeota archaeon]|nr:hypothetical protein [Candidatus Pacearchaeota archaeon]